MSLCHVGVTAKVEKERLLLPFALRPRVLLMWLLSANKLEPSATGIESGRQPARRIVESLRRPPVRMQRREQLLVPLKFDIFHRGRALSVLLSLDPSSCATKTYPRLYSSAPGEQSAVLCPSGRDRQPAAWPIGMTRPDGHSQTRAHRPAPLSSPSLLWALGTSWRRSIVCLTSAPLGKG